MELKRPTSYSPLLMELVTQTLAIDGLELPCPFKYLDDKVQIGDVQYPLLKMAAPMAIPFEDEDDTYIALGSKIFPDGSRRLAILNLDAKPPSLRWHEPPMDNDGNEDLNRNGPAPV